MSRRTLLSLAPATIALAASNKATLAQRGAAGLQTPQPIPDNPFAARSHVYTIVTPDIDVSIHFYRDVMRNTLIEKGKLEGKLPTINGAGKAGRRYALLRHKEIETSERGVIRLLEAPAGAKANRPRPDSKITDPGIAAIECQPPKDWEKAYDNLVQNNVKFVAPPVKYTAGGDFMAWSAFGPAGEQIFFACPISGPFYDTQFPLNHDGLYGPFVQNTLMTYDKWPALQFYEQALGLKPTPEKVVLSEEVNTMIGAPRGTYFIFGNLGGSRPGGLRMEWWEYRQFLPLASPPWPTDLDRTGLAMVTILVNDLPAIIRKVQQAQIPILGEGALPTPEAHSQDAIYIRGSQGELIEVIERKKTA